MTIKEKLYKEWVIAENKYARLVGEELMDESDDFFTSNGFSVLAKNTTKSDLKRMIESANYKYDREVEKLRVENYYNTEEGKEKKEFLLARKEQIENMIEKYKEGTNRHMNQFIKEWLGENWGCNVFMGSMEIGIVEKVHEDGFTSFLFGHSFTLYYGGVYNRTERFDMNYGTMGFFDVFNNVTRSELLIGMGEFVKNKEKLETLQLRLDDFQKQIMEWNTEKSDITNELEHPTPISLKDMKLFNC